MGTVISLLLNSMAVLVIACASNLISRCIYFFFFQAEDGIRDLTVTGVQTCALPISNPAIFEKAIAESDEYDDQLGELALQKKPPMEIYERLVMNDIQNACDVLRPQIGRASCRERV